MKRTLLLSLLIFLTSSAAAMDFASHTVVIPTAGRTAGAFGTQWRTDLYVTNASRRPEEVTVHIIFTNASDGSEKIIGTSLDPRETAAIKDVIRELGYESALGMIRIASTSPDAKLTARARIYNVGSAQGEYGQTVPAMPLTKLSREAYLPGLSGLAGSRTNIGIANPGNEDAAVFVTLFERSGESRGGFGIVVPKRSTRTFNNIFDEFGAGPLHDATVQITSSHGVYAYASIVRSDSGDADFVAGTGVEIDPADDLVVPQCVNPAPLHLAPLPAEGWIVFFAEGTNAEAAANTLAAQYGFTVKSQYLFGFHAVLTAAQVAQLRCEPVVKNVHQNARVIL